MAIIPKPVSKGQPVPVMVAGGMMRNTGIATIDSSTTAPSFNVRGDIKVMMSNGNTISISDILSRLEALETAYMEEKLLGAEPGKIKE